MIINLLQEFYPIYFVHECGGLFQGLMHKGFYYVQINSSTDMEFVYSDDYRGSGSNPFSKPHDLWSEVDKPDFAKYCSNCGYSSYDCLSRGCRRR